MKILMVAEKPSIAQAVANALARGAAVSKRKGISPSAPVFECVGEFSAPGCAPVPAEFRVTSTVGHMWSLDFAREFNDQNKVEPIVLFDATVQHLEDPRPRMTQHLQAEATGCDALVLCECPEEELEAKAGVLGGLIQPPPKQPEELHGCRCGRLAELNESLVGCKA